MSDITIDIKNNNMEVLQKFAEPWRVTLVDTGLETMTGGRLKRVEKYLEGETFCFTYGDGLCDVSISDLIAFHKSKKTVGTLTAVQPPGRYGTLSLQEDVVNQFIEKPSGDGGWVNGGFFVLEPQVFDYLKGDSTIWEREPLEQMAKGNQLSAYKHKGFWQAMDTLRDKNYLEDLWNSGKASWKTW